MAMLRWQERLRVVTSNPRVETAIPSVYPDLWPSFDFELLDTIVAIFLP
jgi:hypothetical protein